MLNISFQRGGAKLFRSSAIWLFSASRRPGIRVKLTDCVDRIWNDNWRQSLCQHEDEIIIWFRTFGKLIWQWSRSLEFPTLLKQPPKTTLRHLSPQIDQIPGRGHLQQCRGQLWECGHYWHRGHLQICQPLWQLGRLHQLRQKQQQPFGRSQQFGQLQHQQWNRALNRSWPEEIQDNDVGDDDWHDQVDCVHCGGHCDGVRLCQGNIHLL